MGLVRSSLVLVRRPIYLVVSHRQMLDRPGWNSLALDCWGPEESHHLRHRLLLLEPQRLRLEVHLRAELFPGPCQSLLCLVGSP